MEELIFRAAKGTASAEEVLQVEAWRRQSAANERQFQQLARLLELTHPLPATAVSRNSPPDGSTLRAAADQREQSRERWLAINRWSARAAAIVVLVAGGWGVGRLLVPAPPLAFRADEFVTGPLDMATVRLNDGSVVRLGPRSQLLVERDSRTVTLHGRAYFAVAHMADRPFRVRTEAGDALVLGTRFDLRADSGQVQVVVVEGTVALASTNDTVRVRAGQTSRVVDGHTAPASPVPDVTAAVRWTGKLLVFQDTPLARAVAEIQREYGTRVQLLDQRLGSETVTAWFQDKNFTEVMRVICGVLNARCAISSDSAAIGTAEVRLPVPASLRSGS